MRAEESKITSNRVSRNARNKHSWLESLFVLILGLYPFRHIYVGLDLWDTGYNYANFQYMGMEHMDSMWLFSTYLANVVGNFLMKLPSAGTLAGMNLYTGIFASALALMGYCFCTKKLNIPPVVTFIGEFAALSLCWCPTALLYNYLTYFLFLICVILLYQGLLKEKKWYLFLAGICLGTNVLVRFSNLPEAAMILAVWAYGVIEALEWRKHRRTMHIIQGTNGQNTAGQNANGQDVAGQEMLELRKGKKEKSGAWARTVNRTLWCMGGYLSALLYWMAQIGIRYGLDEYVTGISRLFAMTDHATDYKPTSMLMGIVSEYKINLYWLVRILVIVLPGICAFTVVRLLFKHCKALGDMTTLRKIAEICCYGISVILGVATPVWLYARGFCSLSFYSYDPILRPTILFLMLVIIIATLRILQRNTSKEKKLISGLVLLVILLTPIGSNNGLYPAFNNLFVAAPYAFGEIWSFIRSVKEKEFQIGKKLTVSLNPFPAKCIVTAFLAMFLFQSICFGAKFVFAEATGVQDTTATVENNEILKGIQMSPERAEWLSSISTYVEENKLQGREVILYGWIPSLSYYLQMPPAYNSWSDLDSFNITQMEAELTELAGEMNEKGKEQPVIIAEKKYGQYLKDGNAWINSLGVDEKTAQEIRQYLEDGNAELSSLGVGEKTAQAIRQYEKWQLLAAFMEQQGYEKTFENDKFVLWE